MVSSDKELEGQLVDAGKKLLHPPPSIDDLLPLLDHIENCLSKVEQSPRKSMQDALSALQNALVANELIKHSEVDVKVAVASCISEITRISAPEAPYVDDVMKEVFELIVSSFDNISDKSSRSFVKRVSILETVSKVRSCVVMLDLECDSLIVEMFRHFFREIRDYHDENVFSSMETIMTLVIDESEDISADLLCLVLDSVKKDEKAYPMSKKLGEKVLENCAKKLKPFLGPSLKSLGVNSDDYSVIVASICECTNGVVEQSLVHAVNDERAVSPEDGPASSVSPNTIGCNGLISRDKSPTASNCLKKEDGHENLTSQESVDANESKQGDIEITAEMELQPEQDGIKTENKPISSAEACNLATDTLIAEECPQKKEDQPLESSPEQPVSLLQTDTYKPDLPAESRAEASVELHSSKSPQNESADTALLNQIDDVHNESKACEEGSSKQEDEVEGAEVPSNDLTENKTEEKEDLAGEINVSKGAGVSTGSSSEEKTLTVEDSVKDTEVASDSAATKSNKSKKKVNVKPEKKNMSGRMQEEQEIFIPPNKGNDALKSSKNFDKNEMVHPLKSSGKEKHLSVETPKGSLKRNNTPSKEEGSGSKKDGAALVGSKIKVWWPMDKAFYKGRVVDFDAVTKKHRILYLDGDVEVLFLRKERWEIIKDDSGVEDEAVEGESLDASLETPPKKAAKLMKPTHSATKHGKMVSINKQGGGSSSSKSKVDVTTLTAYDKSKNRKDDDAGGESSFRTPKSDHKSVNAIADKTGKSMDNDASTSSKVTNPEGNVSVSKNPPIKAKHETPESSGKSKSKRDSNSKLMGKAPKSTGKSSDKDDSGKVGSIPAKSKDDEATDDDEEEEEEEDSRPGSSTGVASNKKRKMLGTSSSSKGKVGKSGSGKKRRRRG